MSVAFHEVGHEIANSNPEAFNIIKEFVFEYLKKKGIDVNQRINNIKYTYRNVFSAEEAQKSSEEEIVCNALMSIPSEEKAMEVINDMEQDQKRSLLSALKKFIQKIKAFLSKYAKTTAETKAYIGDVENITKLAEMVKNSIIDTDRKSEPKNNTSENSNVKYSIRNTKDITWGEQINNYFSKNGLIKHSDTLVVEKSTPDYLLQYVDNLPLVLPIRVISKAQSKKDISHSVNTSAIKKIQSGVRNAVATIYNEGRNSILFITDIKQGEYPLVVAFEINSVFDGDSVHKCTSIHLRTNLASYLANLNGTTVFVKNKNELNALCREVNILDRLQKNNKLIDVSLSQGNEDVKNESEDNNEYQSLNSDITQSQQFKNWFGDWQNHPESASKVVDSNGEPLIVYHQTDKNFTAFDTKQKGAGEFDSEMPTGIFMKPTNTDIGVSGNIQMPLYANIKNPLVVNNRSQLVDFYNKTVQGYKEAKTSINDIDSEYKGKFQEEMKRENEEYQKLWIAQKNGEITEEEYQKSISRDALDDILEEWNNKVNEANLKAKSLIDNFFENSNYDGVIVDNDTGSFGRSTKTFIALKNTQVKSATDNIGTFDGNNPDIRYSLEEPGDYTDDDFSELDSDNDLDFWEAAEGRTLTENERRILEGELADLDRKVSEKVKDTTAILEEMNNLTRDMNVNETDLKKILRKYCREYSSKKNVDAFTRDAKIVINALKVSKSQEEFNINFRLMCGLFKDMLEKSEGTDDIFKEEREDIKSQLKRINKIVLNQVQYEEAVSAYDGWKNYRNQIFHTANICKPGSKTNSIVPGHGDMSLDEVWATLAEQYPEFFDSSISDGDQPLELIAVLNRLKPQVVNPVEQSGLNLNDLSLDLALKFTADVYDLQYKNVSDEKVQQLKKQFKEKAKELNDRRKVRFDKRVKALQEKAKEEKKLLNAKFKDAVRTKGVDNWLKQQGKYVLSEEDISGERAYAIYEVTAANPAKALIKLNKKKATEYREKIRKLAVYVTRWGVRPMILKKLTAKSIKKRMEALYFHPFC